MSVAAPQGPKPGRSWKQCLPARAGRIYLIFAGVFFAAALVWGGLAIYAALDLNPQGVFCDYSLLTVGACRPGSALTVTFNGAISARLS